jgi:hypothetical protein
MVPVTGECLGGRDAYNADRPGKECEGDKHESEQSGVALPGSIGAVVAITSGYI